LQWAAARTSILQSVFPAAEKNKGMWTANASTADSAPGYQAALFVLGFFYLIF
jgi:hypothetical protein